MTLETFLPWVGGLAALLTSMSCAPQVRKVLPRGSTDDLTWKTLVILTLGLAIWIVYGVLKADWVIMAGNGVGATLSAICKIRNLRSAA
jgi:MtN3 and saliva related transmembrane protein